MYQLAFQYFDDRILPIVGLLLFFLTFISCVGWVFYYSRQKDNFKVEANLPLREDPHA